MTAARSAVFSAVLVALGLLLAEGAARVALAVRARSPRARRFAEAQATAASYAWREHLGVVMPLPGKEIVLYKDEYTDRFPTRDILGDGVGFFDDGLDRDRPVAAVALGDSFTRGVGSGNNLERGWVELVERRLPWLDVVNLGNSGTGPRQQFYFYSKVARLIPHQIVIVDFYSGNDFLDDADPFDWNKALAALPAGTNRSAVFVAVQRALAYQASPDFLSGCQYALKSACLAAALAARARRTEVLPPGVRDALALYDRLRETAPADDLPAEVRQAALRAKTGWRQIDASLGLPFRFWTQSYERDRADAAALAGHSARLINEFSRSVGRTGKKVVFVLHPTMLEVYATPVQLAKLGGDPELPKRLLKAELDRDIPVLDLTPALRRRAAAGGPHLYWLRDDHYSPAGYAAAAEEIAAFLESRFKPSSLQVLKSAQRKPS